jgi:hypothetical protein
LRALSDVTFQYKIIFLDDASVSRFVKEQINLQRHSKKNPGTSRGILDYDSGEMLARDETTVFDKNSATAAFGVEWQVRDDEEPMLFHNTQGSSEQIVYDYYGCSSSSWESTR